MKRPIAGLACFFALLALAGCSGAGLLNAVTSRAGYSVERGIRYTDGARGTLDLYVPAGATPRTPVVVFIYGGGWDSGSKDIYRFVGQSLASAGIAVAVPDYRIYPQARFPGFVEDAAKAVVFVDRASRDGGTGLPAGQHPLFLMGHSAGGEIAALLVTDKHYLRDAGVPSRRLAGFIGLAGPYDFLPLKEERYKRVFPVETRDASQPVNFVDGTEPPMLLLAGDADTTVDPKNTRSLAAKVRGAGGTVDAEILPGADHIGVLSGLATALPVGERSVRRLVLDFIAEHS